MKKGILLAALAGGAAYYWASQQPGGCSGTWDRFVQGVQDIQAGQDPVAVGKRFFGGSVEEPAGMVTEGLPWDSYLGEHPNPHTEQVVL